METQPTSVDDIVLPENKLDYSLDEINSSMVLDYLSSTMAARVRWILCVMQEQGAKLTDLQDALLGRVFEDIAVDWYKRQLSIRRHLVHGESLIQMYESILGPLKRNGNLLNPSLRGIHMPDGIVFEDRSKSIQVMTVVDAKVGGFREGTWVESRQFHTLRSQRYIEKLFPKFPNSETKPVIIENFLPVEAKPIHIHPKWTLVCLVPAKVESRGKYEVVPIQVSELRFICDTLTRQSTKRHAGNGVTND